MEPFKYISITDWAKAQKTTRTAVELADSGIPVFPCKQDKAPDTAHSFYDATTDPSRIAFFFRKPDALIGMPTGLASNIDVIDEDPRNGGDLDTLGPLPMDVVARTRSGGRHVYFRHRDGVTNTTGLRQGIDVRGKAGTRSSGLTRQTKKALGSRETSPNPCRSVVYPLNACCNNCKMKARITLKGTSNSLPCGTTSK